MSLLFFDGFQDCATSPKPEYTDQSMISVAGRDGSTNGACSMGSNGKHLCALPSAAATCIAGIAFDFSGASNGSQALWFASSSTVNQLFLVFNSSGMIEARRSSVSGTLLGTSSGHAPVGVAEWVSLQAKVLLHTSAGSVEVKLRGVTVLTLTGVQTSTVIGSVTHIGFGVTGAGGCYVDDFYVCDAVDATSTQGLPNNDFLGDMRIQTLLPTSDGDSSQFTPSTGSNHSALVDEVPPNTSDYNSDATTGHRDLYQMGDLTGTIAAIYAIREGLYVGKSDAGMVTVKPLIKENSTVTSDSAQGVTTSYGPVYGSIKTVKPSDSTLWTTTDVNALQAGAEIG